MSMVLARFQPAIRPPVGAVTRGVRSRPRVDIVLVKDFPQLGYVGEVHPVKAGFARNHLIPQRLALYATPDNRQKHAIEKGDERLEKIRQQRQTEHARRRLSQIQLQFKCRVNQNQDLYGSVTGSDITNLLFEKYNIDISPDRVQTSELRSVGVHEVAVAMDGGETATLKVNIEPLS